MKIISVIEDEPVESLRVEREVIKKILKHLGLWDIKTRPPPKASGQPKTPEYGVSLPKKI